MDNQSRDNVNRNSENSLFSRRRLLQTGIAASPLLLSVKSPVAWGCGNTNTQGSMNTMVSGNVSTVAGGCQPRYKCQKPSIWHDILHSYDHEFKSILDWSNINRHTSFNSIFLSNNFYYRDCSNRYWQYKLMSRQCDNPAFGQALTNNTIPQLFLRVKHKYRSKVFDVRISDIYVHPNITCGYLNSICAPDFIESAYYPSDILSAVRQSIHGIADTVQRNRSNVLPYNNPLKTLSINLGRTWS